MLVIELKSCSFRRHPSRSILVGTHVYQEAGFCTGYGFHAACGLSLLRGTLTMQSEGENIHLSRLIPLQGVRPNHALAEPQSYRSLPPGPEQQSLSQHTDIRAISNRTCRRLHTHQADPAIGVLCDQTIVRIGAISKKNSPKKFKSIKFHDPQSGKTLVFLTNNFTLPTLTVAQ